jgi:glycogen debranching enzyme
MSEELQKFRTPQGEEFAVSDEATDRVLNEGIPFIIVDMKERRLAIKEGDLFFYTNTEGNIPLGNTSGLGFYYEDTRFLSCYEFKINGRDPILLSSSAEQDYLLHVELTNTDIWKADELIVTQETLNIRRQMILKDCLYERTRIKNYNDKTVALQVELLVNSDFSDIFEIRGQRRLRRGQIMQPKFTDNTLKMAYLGNDNVFRQTEIELSLEPTATKITLDKISLLYEVEIAPYGRFILNIKSKPIIEKRASKKVRDFNEVSASLKDSYSLWNQSCANIYSDNEVFNSMVERSQNDLRALMTTTEHGNIFDAGIPWFVAPFGRDSLITARESLILNTECAKNSLEFLAKLQGTKYDNWRDEEPGKILHEIRRGELATLGEIPHTPYYGSVDSTALFLILVWDYLRWTNDHKFINKLMPNIKAAIGWLDNYADLDGDGFVEYKRRSARGLTNQGWKDSTNSVMHLDGTLAEAPIALAEVQGYAYHARKSMAQLFEFLGKTKESEINYEKAEKLKAMFNDKFWIENENYFAIALDKDKEQVKTIASNPGHCLWSGIVDDAKAKKMRDRLLQPDMFSGWGIRTISKAAKQYNPMSYHNGSVWPHDTAIIAYGLKKYGFVAAGQTLTSSLFDVSQHQTYNRLPELFCGFTRRGNNWPVEYPVACSPQAWSAGAVFFLLESLLGINPDATKNTLFIENPHLPTWLERVTLKNLKVGESSLDIRFAREGEITSFTVLKRTGKLKIIFED